MHGRRTVPCVLSASYLTKWRKLHDNGAGLAGCNTQHSNDVWVVKFVHDNCPNSSENKEIYRGQRMIHQPGSHTAKRTNNQSVSHSKRKKRVHIEGVLTPNQQLLSLTCNVSISSAIEHHCSKRYSIPYAHCIASTHPPFLAESPA